MTTATKNPAEAPSKKGLSFQLNQELARKVRMVAASKNMSATEYIESHLDPAVERDLSRVLEAFAQK